MSVIETARPAETRVVTRPDVPRREVLLAAAEIVKERGWTRGVKGMPHHHADDSGKFCLLGSIVQAALNAGYITVHHEESVLVFDRDGRAHGSTTYAADLLGVAPRDAWNWNDTRPLFRGKRQVIARLREEAEQT